MKDNTTTPEPGGYALGLFLSDVVRDYQARYRRNRRGAVRDFVKYLPDCPRNAATAILSNDPSISWKTENHDTVLRYEWIQVQPENIKE